jgi:hypothetical protein
LPKSGGDIKPTLSEDVAMTEFVEKTWIFWWVCCTVVILWWFHRASSMGEVEGEIESTSTKTSAGSQPGTSDSGS